MSDRRNRWQRRKRPNADAAVSKFQELKLAFLDPDELDQLPESAELDSPFDDIHDRQPGNGNGQVQNLEPIDPAPTTTIQTNRH
jgi:predicted RNA-binding protein with EMAP domain